MDADKYNRAATLLCPTCGVDQFLQEEATGEAVQMAKCASCGREMTTKEDLIQENNENIAAHVDEVKQEIVDDIRKQLSKIFKK